MSFRSVGKFSNETEKDISIYLEIRCEQVIISPGLEMELLIEDIEGALPVNILYCEGSLQIYPSTSSPDWLVLFNGKEIVPGYPTRLSEH